MPKIKSERLKKRHNQRGRVQRHVTVRANDSADSQVHLDPSVFDKDGYGSADVASSNQMVLPSVKNDKRKALPMQQVVKQLSKKQRKHLEKVVDQKRKKEQVCDFEHLLKLFFLTLSFLLKRSKVIEDLEKYRIDISELDKMVPVVSLSRGSEPKRAYLDTIKNDKKLVQGEVRIRSVAGSRKRGNEALENNNVPIEKMNLVESSSSEDEQSEVEDDKMAEEKEEVPEAQDEGEVEIVAEENCNEQEQEKLIEQIKEEPKCELIEPNADPEPTIQGEPVEEVQSDKAVEPVRKLQYQKVARDDEIQESRLKLPILSEEHSIMEAIADNPVVIICGETGSGKTTQVPQFLYEAGYAEYGTIGVTEPRRVAAVAMSRRVGEEMSLVDTGEVSYVIRYEGTASKDTKIKFMTDGVLLKEVENDFLLLNYSVIVIDEAHERSVFTDILIGLLSRIVRLRAKKGNPLKLIIMSATLRVDDFISNRHLFNEIPPVIKIESRQYPVTVHFTKQTPVDYMSEAYKKVVKIHKEQPAGGILVFVTGQDEVHWLVSKLRDQFGDKTSERNGKNMKKNDEQRGSRFNQNNNNKNNNNFKWRKTVNKDGEEVDSSLFDRLKVNLDEYSLNSEIDNVDNDVGNVEEVKKKILDSDDGEGNDDDDDGNGSGPKAQPMWVLPLYALLPTEKQQLVFKPPPNPDARFVVVATNVGETSLTIPNIRYVVDTGKQFLKLFFSFLFYNPFNF